MVWFLIQKVLYTRLPSALPVRIGMIRGLCPPDVLVHQRGVNDGWIDVFAHVLLPSLGERLPLV